MSMLEIKNLTLEFGVAPSTRRVVAGVSLTVKRGETLVLVGESGSGKSLTALSILRLLPLAARVTAGEILVDDIDLLRLPARRMSEFRGRRIGYVFQEPQTALNPVMTIGDQIGEVLTRHLGLRGAARTARVIALLDAVGIAAAARRRREYPHQFSGGMKQRVMLAIALAGEPAYLIADEPTTALDVTLQAQVLTLLREQQLARQMGMLFITHDLAVAHQIADTIAVMKDGQIVEVGTREQIFRAPQADYTRQLLAASPRLGGTQLPALPTARSAVPLLEVVALNIRFPIRGGVFRRTTDTLHAVNNVSLTVAEGETLALVGESGSGKTTLGRGIVQLIDGSTGEVRLRGSALAELSREALRQRRREFQVVFQDPYASMNPRLTVHAIIEEGMLAQGVGGGRTERRARLAQLMQQVGLEPTMLERYPHEFSGGQRQRICIARALAVDPKLLICDEPTSALDVSVQAQILTLLRELQLTLGLAYVFITHNLAVVASIAHRVAVMYQGQIVEIGPVNDVLYSPQHPYTQQLLAAVPRLPG